jgi:hypothetical protein
MTPEQRLLQQIREALAEVDVDVEPLLEEAFATARAEVADTLRRLISQDLLRRTLGSLDHGRSGDASSPAGPGAPPRGRPEPEPTATTPEPSASTGEPTPAAAGPVPDPSTLAPGPHPSTAIPEPEATPASDAAPGARATYVLGVTVPGDLALAELAPLPGGGPARALATEEVQAIVCDVDTSTFEVLRSPGPEGLETLAAAAHAHDANLAWLAGETTVLPLPLGTVLLDDDVVIDLLRTHGTQLRGELERFEGYAEWAVRVHLLDAPDAGDEAARSADSGSEYLRRRSVALEEKQTRWRTREALATRMHERLGAGAAEADVVVSRPLEDVAPPLLHGVYLLAERAVPELERTVEELRAEHADAVIEMTGPWPPYHFASIDLSPSEPGP